MKYSFEDVDERIIKTRLALVDAILNLIRKHAKTKVLDICHEAHITPMTYYHHFGNKKQLLEYTIKKQLQGILPIPRKLKPLNVKHLVFYLLNGFNNFVRQHHEIILSTIKQSEIEGYYDSYLDLSIRTIKALVWHELNILKIGNQPRTEIFNNLICGALIHVFLDMTINNWFINIKDLWDSIKNFILLLK